MYIENLTFKLDNGKANIAIQISPHNKELETAINVQTNTFAQRWRIKALLTHEIKSGYPVF
jgi:hypothetical protein